MCLPGMECYDAFYQPIDDSVYTISDYVLYVGPNLPATGINNRNTLTTALSLIDTKLLPANLVSAIIAELLTNPTLKAQFCSLVHSC